VFYLWCLLIFEILFFLLFFILNKQDIMAPSVVMTLVFIFSTFVAILNGNNWNIKYEFTSFSLLSIGIFLFGIIDIFVRQEFGISKKKNQI